jgi:hypothetical protein
MDDREIEELINKINKIKDLCNKYDRIPSKPGDKIWTQTEDCFIKLNLLKNQLNNIKQ